MRALRSGALLAVTARAFVGCGAPSRPAGDVIGASSRAASRTETDAVDFAFDSLDARPVSAAATRGRPTVLAFVATWDLTSQAQVDFLVPMSAHDGDRVTYALVALQEAQDRELVEAYKTTLKVTFPVALADRATIAGGGPFGDVHAVPTLIVLDRRGRVVWRQVGLARSDDIRAALKGL